MELYELDDLHDKIIFHCSEIEQNVTLLETLVDSFNMSNDYSAGIRSLVRHILGEIEQKYEMEKERIVRGDKE